MRGNLAVVIGAGLVGAHYTKLLLSQGYHVFATVRNLETEEPLFARRVFGASAPGYYCPYIMNRTGGHTVTQFTSRTTCSHFPLVLAEFDMFNGDYTGDLLYKDTMDLLFASVQEYASSYCLSGSLRKLSLDHIVNAVNLGTVFGMRALSKEGDANEVFDFSLGYNTALQEQAKKQGHALSHLFVSTTGSGGIGLEHMRISHNLGSNGIPPSIILKRQKAQEILSYFADFKASNNGTVVHHAVVPASAIVDLEIYAGEVAAYGEYKQRGHVLRAYAPEIRINGIVHSSLREIGALHAQYGLFGEDGPHTLADLQQLQMFMGMTTATKVAQIMRDTIQRKGAHNYDVLHAGQQIPEMSEYAVHSFAKKYQRMKQEGKYVPVTLSPIAPFDIALHCVVYELLADAGFEHLSHFADAPVNNEAMASLADTIQAMLHQQPDRLIAYTSLGVAFDITGRDHYQTQGAFTRGTVNNKKIRDAIIHAKEFSDYKEHSVKMQDFFEMYESQAGIATKEVIGYLAAFPVARDMRKEGHF